jgi:hypothetical protein
MTHGTDQIAHRQMVVAVESRQHDGFDHRLLDLDDVDVARDDQVIQHPHVDQRRCRFPLCVRFVSRGWLCHAGRMVMHEDQCRRVACERFADHGAQLAVFLQF